LIQSLSKQENRGLVFLRFENEYHQLQHESLRWSLYQHLARHPKANPAEIRWVAFLTNVNYQPFLAQRFPKGRWIWLDQDQQGLILLGVVPVNDEYRSFVADWLESEDAFQSVINHFNHFPDLLDLKKPSLQKLDHWYADIEKDLPDDPFLKAVLLEKRRWLLMLEGDKQEAEKILDRAIAESYPAAHFWSSLGYLRLGQNDRGGARAAFREAARRLPSACSARKMLIQEFGEDPYRGKAIPLPQGLEIYSETTLLSFK